MNTNEIIESVREKCPYTDEFIHSHTSWLDSAMVFIAQRHADDIEEIKTFLLDFTDEVNEEISTSSWNKHHDVIEFARDALYNHIMAELWENAIELCKAYAAWYVKEHYKMEEIPNDEWYDIEDSFENFDTKWWFSSIENVVDEQLKKETTDAAEQRKEQTP